MNSLKLAVFGAAILVAAGVYAVASAVAGGGRAHEDERVAKVVRVIDGDTFVIAGGARIRVKNFDTPELRRYDCPQEKLAAQGARRAARSLLSGETVRLEITDKDRYGRLVANVILLKAAGRERDFVEAMVASGHGARWNYGAEPQPRWCPQPTWRGFFGF